MKLQLLAASAALLLAVPAQAGPAEDATAAVTTWLDKFNAGDVEAFYAGHADGAVIVDELSLCLGWTANRTALARGLHEGRRSEGHQRRPRRL